MRKTLLILAATLVVASPAFARPSRRYRRPCRRPCVVEHHHHHHRSHCWHSSDWGKFVAGAAIGWLVNETSSPRQEVVCESQTVCPPPVYTPPPVCRTTVVSPTVLQPVVYETVTRTPCETIVSLPCATELYTPQPSVTVIRQSPAVRVTRSATIVRSYVY